ncbi:hypothetical protein CLOM_g2992 [Closterium sp. NIES-68]|nr:hypothetical protein CLOM_g2992 [Closterium sp. NIES-68]GJP85667.1 hypothetical protein CLOP_g15777 [Closterium sp. NIES-67]
MAAPFHRAHSADENRVVSPPAAPTPRGEGQPGAPGGRGGGGGGGGGAAGRIAHSPSYPNSGYATNGDGNLGGSRRSLEGGGGSSKALSRSSSGAVANADATGGNGEVGSSRWLRRGESGEGSGKHWSGTSSALSASSETPRAWASQLSASGDNSGGAILELGDYNDQMATSPYPEAIKEEEGSVEGRNVPMPDVTLEEELSESLMPLKWVFFPEADPIQQFRGKPWREKIWVFLKGVFPILEWLPKYDLRYYLLGDIIGGVSIAIMSVPQDVSYAKYANLPAEFALRTSFIPPLLYAIQGSSKHLVIAPVSVVSQLLGTTLSGIVDPSADPALYTSLAVTATFFCGIFQLIMGLCRFGFLVDFLNQPTIVGFLSGCSLTIAIQQLKLILGYKDFTLSTSIVNIIAAIVQYSSQFQWKAFVMGMSFFLYLTTVRALVYLKPKNKVFYYLNALGPLTSIVISTIIVSVAGLSTKGIPTIGKIGTGLHGASSISYLNFSSEFVADVATVGFIACLVCLAESVGIARTFASLYGYHIDGNKEMVAFGSMNLVGSFTSCYVATGSFSRTAVNMLAGARTAVTQVIMSGLILLVLLVAAPLFKNVPNCVVGAVIANAALNLLDFHAAWSLWKVDKMDFLVMSGCFLAILFGSPEIGLLVAILLSLIKILLRSLRPHIRLLGLLPNAAATAVSVLQFPNSTLCEGIVMLRIESPLYFPGANFVRQRVKKLCDAYARGYQQPVKHCVLDLSVMHDIDVTAIEAMRDLHRDLTQTGIQLCLASANRDVLRKMFDAQLLAEIGEQWLFVTPADAVKLCRAVALSQPAAKESEQLLTSVETYDI